MRFALSIRMGLGRSHRKKRQRSWLKFISNGRCHEAAQNASITGRLANLKLSLRNWLRPIAISGPP